VRTRCLSFHAAYRCRHSGECCRAGWDIDVEPHIVEAVLSGRVRPLLSTPVAFEPVHGPAEAGFSLQLARTAAGDCGFHNHHRCSLQEAGTEAMLPSACRHFPRVFLRDARGCLLTLSHFCPTAASMLFDAAPVTIVEAPPSLALEEPIEGLDARDALPPLLRPGMLTDIAGYAAWEQAVVQTLLESADPDTALAKIDSATELLREWTPAAGALTHAVADAFSHDPPRARHVPLSRSFAIVLELTGPHPLMQVPAAFEDEWTRIEREAGDVLRPVLARYLAASAFGNWIAYRGQGLRSVVAWLHACHDVVRIQLVRHLRDTRMGPDPAPAIEAVRMADYVMVHTVDSLAFGRAAISLER
jgi:hypothetical protein